MRFLLDTNTITAIVERNQSALSNYTQKYEASILIPIVAHKEIVAGWINLIQSEKGKQRVYAHWQSLFRYLEFMRLHEVLSLTDDIIEELENLPKGKPPIKEADRLIAACAIATGYTLVTSDRHFDQLVPQEQIVDWTIDTTLEGLDG